MQLPELCEGWSWRLSRAAVDGHPKVRIELLLHDDVRRNATIDVQMYGDTSAVVERAQSMLASMAAEQLRAIGIT